MEGGNRPNKSLTLPGVFFGPSGADSWGSARGISKEEDFEEVEVEEDEIDEPPEAENAEGWGPAVAASWSFCQTAWHLLVSEFCFSGVSFFKKSYVTCTKSFFIAVCFLSFLSES